VIIVYQKETFETIRNIASPAIISIVAAESEKS